MNQAVSRSLAFASFLFVGCSGGGSPTPPSGTDGGTGAFQVFDCTLAYTCSDGAEATLPLETCSTTNTISLLIHSADIQNTCDQGCSISASACEFSCSPTGRACACPSGVLECSP